MENWKHTNKINLIGDTHLSAISVERFPVLIKAGSTSGGSNHGRQVTTLQQRILWK